MANPPKIFLSPFVLSTVMFDNSNSLGDQEGFLIGSTQKSVRREISDQSMYNTEEDLLISIYSCIPCGEFLSFYDSVGTVNTSRVRDLLGDRSNCIVGWYRFRRNLVAYPSAREMKVHEGLEKLFPGNIAFGGEYFVLGVFGSSCFPTVATHTYDYAFFVQSTESFKSLSINLLNLGDTKSEYRMDSISSAFVNSTTFDSVLSVPWDFGSSWQAEDVIQQMHKMLREKCDNLAEELTASESVNCAIEQEIFQLSTELQRLTSLDPGKTRNFESDQGDNQEKHSSGKRPINESSAEDIPHPLYGKYFPQNRPQDPAMSNKTTTESHVATKAPPSKKIKVHQDRTRILDHDYSGASDDEASSQTACHESDSAPSREERCIKTDNKENSDEEIQYNKLDETPQPSTVVPPISPTAVNPPTKELPKAQGTNLKSSPLAEDAQVTSSSNKVESKNVNESESKIKQPSSESAESQKQKTNSLPSSTQDCLVQDQDTNDSGGTNEAQKRPLIVFCTAASQSEKATTNTDK